MSKPVVVILTWCGDIDALYGTLLTFKTVRVGFPDNKILVFDNGSVPEALPAISDAVRSVGAAFIQEPVVKHHQFLRKIVFSADCPVVFADPDLIFWEPMKFGPGVSGRLIPEFYDDYTGTLTKARLHTSLLSIEDPQALTKAIKKVEAKYWESDLFCPVMLPGWTRYDTAATLYAALGGNAFTTELDSYDHLFCGSHFKSVAHKLGTKAQPSYARHHELARSGNLAPLRGIWREQEQFFKGTL